MFSLCEKVESGEETIQKVGPHHVMLNLAEKHNKCCFYVYRSLAKKGPCMGRAPYRSAKEGGGRSFDCFRIEPRKSTHVMFTAT